MKEDRSFYDFFMLLGTRIWKAAAAILAETARCFCWYILYICTHVNLYTSQNKWRKIVHFTTTSCFWAQESERPQQQRWQRLHVTFVARTADLYTCRARCSAGTWARSHLERRMLRCLSFRSLAELSPSFLYPPWNFSGTEDDFFLMFQGFGCLLFVTTV